MIGGAGGSRSVVGGVNLRPLELVESTVAATVSQRRPAQPAGHLHTQRGSGIQQTGVTVHSLCINVSGYVYL